MKAYLIDLICNTALCVLAFFEFMLLCSFAEGHSPLLYTLGLSAAFYMAFHVLIWLRVALHGHPANEFAAPEEAALPEPQPTAPHPLQVVRGGNVA